MTDQTTERTLRWADRTNLLLSLVPSALLLVQVCEAISLRLSLGHWPLVYRDEARGFSALLHLATFLLVILLAVGTLPWLISLHAVKIGDGRRRVLVRVAEFIGGLAALWIIARLNPFGFPEWWAD